MTTLKHIVSARRFGARQGGPKAPGLLLLSCF